MDASTQLLAGHVLDLLRALPDRSVQAVVTSPPYHGLRAYNTPPQLWGGQPDHTHEWDVWEGAGCTCGAWRGELGQEPRVDMFVHHLVLVFREVRRVLRDDGLCFLNLGDTYFGDSHPRAQSTKTTDPGGPRRQSGPGQDDIKKKDLCGIPWAVAFALRRDGWFVRQDVIWSKAGGNCPRCSHRLEKGSGLPEPALDRFVRAHEYFFMLAKRPKYYFDREGAKAKGSPSNRRDVIHLPAAKFRGAHFAVMPTELARIAVRAGTSEHGACTSCGTPYRRLVEKGEPLLELRRACGSDAEGNYDGEALKDYESADAQNPSDAKRRILNSLRERITVGWQKTCSCEEVGVRPCVVLDPFSGAGTTGVAARELGRSYIGLDIDAGCNENIAGPRIAAVKVSSVKLEPLPAGSAVYLGKAEEILQRLPSAIARLVLTDPPYNVSRANNFHTMGRTGINFDWDGDFDQETWLQHADRVLVPGGSLVIWNDWKVLGLVAHLLIDMGYDVKRPLVLKKRNPFPRNVDRSPVQRVEMGLWAVKPGAKWVFNRRPERPYEDFVFEHAVPVAPKGRQRHEAKKPDALWAEILQILTNPGELVVDPFCGGGTLAFAAEKLGRQHISIDDTPHWVEETQLRWREAQQTAEVR